VSRNFDKGSLQNSAAWIIFSSIVITTYGFLSFNSNILGDRQLMDIDFVSIIVISLLMVASILTAVWHRKRIVSLVIIGVVGLVIALMFIKFSAPDLALTQISVEIVTIILLLLALYFLPQKTPKEINNQRIWRDIGLALLSGIGITLFTMMVLSREYDPISSYFINNSIPGGGGTNVVNVILVDFRGFDTLGEIVVLALAGLGIYALLQELILPAPNNDMKGRLWSKDSHPIILQTFTRLMMPLMIMVAVYIFLRGHNLPGGGFIAGLIASVALIVMYLSNGIEWTQKRLTVDMHLVIGLGLLIATATGLVAIGLGYPFLTSAFSHIHWPIVGDFELASAIAFDLGVFLVVVGSTVLSLVQLGKLSTTSHKQENVSKQQTNEKEKY